MKYLALTLLIFIGHSSLGQNKNLLHDEKIINEKLLPWINAFDSFRLSDFRLIDTLGFENNFEQDFTYYADFLSIYKPIVTYSPDKSRFIDIYSYELNLEKKGKYFYANPDIDQAIFLCDIPKGYWNRIYFTTTSSQWVDEVVWLTNTKFLLAGSTRSKDNKNMPVMLIGDIDTQSLEEYVNTTSFSNAKQYISTKLK
jgi:hypothetical protein